MGTTPVGALIEITRPLRTSFRPETDGAENYLRCLRPAWSSEHVDVALPPKTAQGRVRVDVALFF
jgi:hypothetical protein